jgi:tRNA1(Val) A37 N6-methylase TrmN6
VKTLFAQVPYLNSSLFEPTELEHQTLFISGLEDHVPLPYLSATVIKDANGKKKTGSDDALNYFFSFLDAYDFASEGSEDIQEDNKTLINASVLGLIFEKINGYKDGSFYTPGFITMYMCKETIRRAVLQKFNEVKGWDCTDFVALYNQDFTEKEANTIINSIKICDPAVGSGHFLVSALNEMIAIKHDLGVLVDKDGKKLKGYQIDIVNDELMVTDEDGLPFVYNPNNKESQRIQETLFHEKQTIIENCLFGVDINPNSVKICRLRLWIELLKNAYYRENREKKIENREKSIEYRELETLPNIDINIKCGNSLISRFGLEADLKKALKQSKWNMESYKLAVATYRNAENKEQKREMEQLIADIKGNFRSEIAVNDPKKLKLEKLKGELFNYTQQVGLFERSKKEEAEWNKKVNTLSADVQQLETELEEIKSNKIYENAFEWRFEFPEVLNDLGDFVGFDVVIGNPPYVFGGNEGIDENSKNLFKELYISGSGKINLFTLFIEKSFNLLKNDGGFSFIIPNTFLRVTSYHISRKLLIENNTVHDIFDFGNSVFDDAVTTAIVIIASKTKPDNKHIIHLNNNGIYNSIKQIEVSNSNFVIATNIDSNKRKVITKIENNSHRLGDLCDELIFGVVITKNKNEVVSNNKIEGWKPFLEGKDISSYYIKPIHSYLNYTPHLLHRSRSKEIFEVEEKILIQRITGGKQPLKAAYDNKQYYNKESINNIIISKKSNYSTKFILGLINSKLINWYYTNQFTNESTLTVNLSKEYLSKIPIVKVSNESQNYLINKVDEILAIKQTNPTADTSALEREIDLMVYRLYGLSEEEIGIVENS